MDLAISQAAVARVKNPLPAPVECHYCGADVELVSNAEIYGREYGDWPYAYLCRGCGAYVGVHPETDIPLGTLADAETRRARKECKPAFEQLHRKGASRLFVSRAAAYRWLADQLQMPLAACHWGWFTVKRCHQAQAACLALAKEGQANRKATRRRLREMGYE